VWLHACAEAFLILLAFITGNSSFEDALEMLVLKWSKDDDTKTQ